MAVTAQCIEHTAVIPAEIKVIIKDIIKLHFIYIIKAKSAFGFSYIRLDTADNAVPCAVAVLAPAERLTAVKSNAEIYIPEAADFDKIFSTFHKHLIHIPH